jgi:nitroimidazol reductase NimA-like FMN-containing flavoprotein (pyridoxamine 5'-phosphate oxidase superfamily)
MTPDEVAAFLAEPRTAALTTLGADGWPHSAGMWFAPVDDELHMWTYAKSQKAANAQRDKRCSFLAEEGVGYSELRGVLVRGRLQIVRDEEAIATIGGLLYDRYTLPSTGVPLADGPVVEIRRQASKRIGLVLPMDRIASWDHSKIA